MQRLDGISTYQNNVASTGSGSQTGISEGAHGGSVNLSEAVQHHMTARAAAVKQELLQLVQGSVFEGVATEVKGDHVWVSLNNGQSLLARLEHGVSVQVGEPVLFEVTSNQNGQIQIKQVPAASVLNPTLQKALQAADLPATMRNLDMVNAMMQRQLPINKDSLKSMLRILQQYPKASPETLVQMKKLGFEINERTIQQFESYKAGEHALVHRFSELMEQLPLLHSQGKNPTAEGMAELQGKLLDILQNGAEGMDEAGVGAKQQEAGANQQQTVSGILSQQQTEQLQQQLLKIPGMEGNSQIFQQGKLNGNLSAGELLTAIQRQIEHGLQQRMPTEEPQELSFDQQSKGFSQQQGQSMGEQQEIWKNDAHKVLKELFGGKEYKSLMNQLLEEQWLLKPQQAGSKEGVEQLYTRIHRQMESLEQLLLGTGRENPLLGKNVSQVQGNLEMMNQINQLYNYIQIPLKLHNQQAHSDLYVYTNKKRLQDREGELSALLHLELENLGTTDVRIKMRESNVTTNFYLSDDMSYGLVEKHIGGLQKRLEEKGYHCSVFLEKKAEKVDIVENFLEREAPIGKLKRYSFDVLT